MNLPHITKMLSVEFAGPIATVSLDRPAKRNALNDETILGLKQLFEQLPDAIQVAIIQGNGEHFSAGLDLSEVRDRHVGDAIHHSRAWHQAFEQIQFGRVPVISVLKGAVVGGGLELASATHIRVAESSSFYALPEGQRGLFVGGGGSVRISRLIGVPRMIDMMLTGRVLDAHEGHQAGVSQYLVAPGAGLDKAMELAQKIAGNAPMSNYAVMHVLPRIFEQSIQDGMVTEALMAAITQTEPETQKRIAAFLDLKANKVKRPS